MTPKPDESEEPAGPEVYTVQFRQRNEYWTELLMAMSEGNPVGYKTLMETNLNEFYYLYRAHVARVERINNSSSKPAERRRPSADATQRPGSTMPQPEGV